MATAADLEQAVFQIFNTAHYFFIVKVVSVEELFQSEQRVSAEGREVLQSDHTKYDYSNQKTALGGVSIQMYMS